MEKLRLHLSLAPLAAVPVTLLSPGSSCPLFLVHTILKSDSAPYPWASPSTSPRFMSPQRAPRCNLENVNSEQVQNHLQSAVEVNGYFLTHLTPLVSTVDPVATIFS